MMVACSEAEKPNEASSVNSTETSSTETKSVEDTKKTVVETTPEKVEAPAELSESKQEPAPAPAPAPAPKTVETSEKDTSIALNAPNYVLGTHYDTIEPPIDVTSETIQVAELFWYGCGHCFRLEPFMLDWKKTKADYIEFVEVPAIFGPQWRFHAQAFYTTKALGIKETTHQKIFDAIHVNRKRLSNLSQLQDLLEPLGQSPEKVEAAYNSFAVDSNMRSAQLFGQRSGARAVPTIIVDGKYTTSVSKAGGHNQLIQLINYLAKKSKDERKG